MTRETRGARRAAVAVAGGGVVALGSLLGGGGCKQIIGWEAGYLSDGGLGGGGGAGGMATAASSGAPSASSATGASSSSGSTTCTPGAMQACYDGPSGTEDAGACQPGTETCGGDGTWGACTGAVKPQPKTCASTADVACDGLPCVVWANGYGPSPSGQQINAVALDPTDGSMVVTGDYLGTIMFGATTLTADNPPNHNTFVARLAAADGSPVWAKSFDTSRGQAVAVDKSGNVFVGGKSDNATTVVTAAGTASLPNGQFVIKLDKSGAPQWATCIGDTRTKLEIFLVGMSAMVIAPDGDPIIAGTLTYPPLTFTDGTLQGTDAYVAKLSSVDGTSSKAAMGAQWAQLISYSMPYTPSSGATIQAAAGPKIGVDAMGNVYVGSTFTGAAQFGAYPLTSSATNVTDIALATFSKTGQSTGGMALGNGTDQELDGFAVNPFGAVAISGQLQGTLTFTNPTATLSATSAQGDGFVLQMNPGNGTMVYGWGTPFGVNGQALDVGFDTDGDLRVLGWFTGTLDLGVGSLVAGANRMMLLAKLAGTNGAAKWNNGWLYPSTVTAVRLAVAPSGDSFVGGRLDSGPFDLGTGPLISATDSLTAWAGRFAP